MNGFTPPARKPLPPAVRGRIRDRVLSGLDQPYRNRFLHARGPLAVAAGVAVLAAGAVIVGQSVSGGAGEPGQRYIPPTGSSSAFRPLDVKQANAELDRCWATIRAEGKTDRYADRTRWRAVSSVDYEWAKVTAALAEGRPFFCQTTVTTVRVSEPTGAPNYAAGSGTAALFISPEGVIAGLADQSWPGVGTWVVHGDSSGGAQGEKLPYGLFVAFSWSRTDDATGFQVDRWVDSSDRAKHPERLALPRPPAPVSRVDRPAPPADRTSERGQWVKECLSKSDIPVTDPDMWQPGAWTTWGDTRYIMLRAGQTLAYCWHSVVPAPEGQSEGFERWMFSRSDGIESNFGQDRPRLIYSSAQPSGSPVIVTGALPSHATRLEITHGTDQPIQADVWNSTFAALLPFGTADPSDVARAYDAAGNKIYEGSLY